MKNKIIKIREKYDWQNLYEIIANKTADKNDRLFMVLMCLWFVPAKIVLRIVWILLYFPSRLFYSIDNLLDN